MKSILLAFLFTAIVLSSIGQNKSQNYFTNPYRDYTAEKKVFNGIKFSGIIADDWTADSWSELKISFYRKNNKIIGFHPAFSLGYFYNSIYSDIPGDRRISSGIFLETGISTAFHFSFINLRLNNSVKKYFDLVNDRRYHDEYIYVVSIEQGYYFHRFDLTAELGLGYDIFDHMYFYGVYAGINLGILIGNIKYVL
ncbi:MAG: hypothetical protein HOD63_13165 [Bacteroidetes bacterium]|mgnify:FL=1|jgi:hypothetical protein|nr:hypothetical protein [Bacteroidota bacterium]MBT5528997.1 hypothetical protein [Cytophagia bacterium]MBT3802956.1 hypothetical protein [Bacteroidota bacterium]MBT3935979.1 hypothetical protein [Bacteroidota bacterium]MBT4339536.1 hypothetical protein [Bacteroidota bacterium]